MPKVGSKLSWRKYRAINKYIDENIDSLLQNNKNKRDPLSSINQDIPGSSTHSDDINYSMLYMYNNENMLESSNITDFDTNENFTSQVSYSDTEASKFESESIIDYKYNNEPYFHPNQPLNNLSFKDKLANWAITNSVPQTAVTSLLTILREHSCHSELPKDARSLLKTPRNAVVKSIGQSNGEYYHFGIAKGIENIIRFTDQKLPKNLELFAKSTNSQFWPILGSLSYSLSSSSVFPIGIYHGYEKPKDFNEILKDLVEELICIQNGIVIEDQSYSVQFKALICDAPARAYVLYTKCHTGYYSCSKCLQEGQYIGNRICFPEISFHKRTDAAFRNQTQKEHHNGESILLNLTSFKPVTEVPYEYMHLVCLGVTRKLLFLRIKGKMIKQKKNSNRGNFCSNGRLTRSKISSISDNLENLKVSIVKEFARKPRSLRDLDRFKATEFRQILLYTGPVAFAGVLRKDMYTHFLLLHCAIKIFTDSEHFENLIDYAHSLITCFVKGFSHLYGPEYISYNVHGLLHLSEDVKHFGPLDKYSSFQFENYMAKLKKIIRKPDRSLQQVVNRVVEKQFLEKHNETLIKGVKLDKTHFDGRIHGYSGQYFKRAIFPKFCLEISRPDNFCLLNDGTIVEIENFILSAEKKIIGRKFIDSTNLYEDPCPSSILGIVLVNKKSNIYSWPLTEVKCKCLALTVKDKLAIFPLYNLS